VTDALRGLAARLRGDGGLLAGATADPAPDADDSLGAAAAAGVHTRADAHEYALLVEAIREGYLAHYGEGRVLRTEDADLELLAGDHLYALGLERLAALGDLESVTILAGVIAHGARAHAEHRPADAETVWHAGVREVAARGGRPSGA
jgi:hypothetical protein